jgi:hypothetical protein
MLGEPHIQYNLPGVPLPSEVNCVFLSAYLPVFFPVQVKWWSTSMLLAWPVGTACPFGAALSYWNQDSMEIMIEYVSHIQFIEQGFCCYC